MCSRHAPLHFEHKDQPFCSGQQILVEDSLSSTDELMKMKTVPTQCIADNVCFKYYCIACVQPSRVATANKLEAEDKFSLRCS